MSVTSYDSNWLIKWINVINNIMLPTITDKKFHFVLSGRCGRSGVAFQLQADKQNLWLPHKISLDNLQQNRIGQEIVRWCSEEDTTILSWTQLYDSVLRQSMTSLKRCYSCSWSCSEMCRIWLGLRCKKSVIHTSLLRHQAVPTCCFLSELTWSSALGSDS